MHVGWDMGGVGGVEGVGGIVLKLYDCGLTNS